jgi:hypothetical protein
MTCSHLQNNTMYIPIKGIKKSVVGIHVLSPTEKLD